MPVHRISELKLLLFIFGLLAYHKTRALFGRRLSRLSRPMRAATLSG